MCGISGFNFNNSSLITSMNTQLIHRGPDSQKIFLDNRVSLGHTRLSILDLSSNADQPFQYSHNGYEIVIVFNGEIYNYIEIKNQLIEKGYFFKSNSDTEVILASYIEWGEQCVNLFNGMWSFCIYDKNKEILFLSRDRLGVKPLYYYNVNGVFIFSSEIKALLSHRNLNIDNFENLNRKSIELYFATGYIPAPLTIYSNVNKLQNGYNLIFNLKDNKILNIYKYYNIPESDNSNVSISNLIEEGQCILKDAVKIRMRSDVAVGAFLSGGIDSSTIVSEVFKSNLNNNFHTFSIGFDDERYDESKYINIVKNKFKTLHHHYIYQKDDFIDFWPEYSKTFDEPFADYSAFPTLKVSSIASENVTVVLSGDGGDEIFGGYPIYSNAHLIEIIKKLPNKSVNLLYNISKKINIDFPLIHKIQEILKLSLNPKEKFYTKYFSESRYKPESYNNFVESRLKESLSLSNNNLSEALRIFDLSSNTLADNFLVKVDRASMRNSIEVRSPFLDYRFISYSQKIPTNLKSTFFDNKILLKKIISNSIPNEILNRKKMGFTPPIENWIKDKDSKITIDRYIKIIDSIDINLGNFYRNKVLNTFPVNYMTNSYLIKLLIFGNWFDFWINKQKTTV
jgi:asparagine synthase (glutamine-hydrolysing)